MHTPNPTQNASSLSHPTAGAASYLNVNISMITHTFSPLRVIVESCLYRNKMCKLLTLQC